MMSQRRVVSTTERGRSTSVDPSGVTVQIVSAIAEREGIDPMNLEPPLYDAIDPDALTAITDADPAVELTLSFNYAGYRVTVIADNEVVVEVTPR